MSATAEKTLRELALENPAATRIFEKLHLDYCCGGNKTLRAACNAAGMSAEEVIRTLEAAARPVNPGRDWSEETLAELMTHIRETHHRYTRDSMEGITALAAKVRQAHGGRHPELAEIQAAFAALAAELTTHLMKEEMVLFPYVERLEEWSAAGDPILPPPFGSVRNPVSMMLREHDNAGEALRELRRLTNGYRTPADACTTFQALYRALADLEADLHQHIHLENNILFPRAIELEGGRP